MLAYLCFSSVPARLLLSSSHHGVQARQLALQPTQQNVNGSIGFRQQGHCRKAFLEAQELVSHALAAQRCVQQAAAYCISLAMHRIWPSHAGVATNMACRAKSVKLHMTNADRICCMMCLQACLSGKSTALPSVAQQCTHGPC